MGVSQVTVEHEGFTFQLQVDSDSEFEVFKSQLYSLTMVPPENQIIIDSSDVPIKSHADFLARIESGGGTFTVTLLDNSTDKKMHKTVVSEAEKADEELCRILQAQEEALFRKQQAKENGEQVFASKLEGYISGVLQYEDPLRQAKARETVRVEELEEKALMALAKEGKRNSSAEELDHYILVQLLLWFKQSFTWVNSAPCFRCGSDTILIGMGNPTKEELQFGGDRVELYRCKSCQSLTRFPRYNDTLKLLETRSGRCGEWANCFTLYCRAFGFDSRLVLDFTDHLWTECFSRFHGRWMHLDPCEAVFDKPLLYEQGWEKKLTYVIGLSRDGVFDVTKRYTRDWENVRLRRTLASEESVAVVTNKLTMRLRSTFSQALLRRLTLRDADEASELCRWQRPNEMTSEALPGRQTGSTEWRRARGELGSSSASLHVQCPKRQCVDHHVSEVFLALGKLCSLGKDKPSILGETLQAVLGILHKVKKVPYRSRQAMLQSVSLAESVGNRQGASNVQQFFQAIGLPMAEDSISQHRSTDSDPIDIALALTVAIENLESLLASANKNDQSASWLEQLAFYSENERLHGSWAEASGEKADGVGVPSGIATAAFDGLCSTKWLEPNGSKGCWLTYFLADKITSPVHFYELMSANDCPERDPRDWVLEGSSDGGWTWYKLDYRQSQFFNKRFERKRYEVSVDKERLCNAFRLHFLETRDSSSQPRLQLSCVNFYRKKE